MQAGMEIGGSIRRFIIRDLSNNDNFGNDDNDFNPMIFCRTTTFIHRMPGGIMNDDPRRIENYWETLQGYLAESISKYQPDEWQAYLNQLSQYTDDEIKVVMIEERQRYVNKQIELYQSMNN